LQDVFCLWSLQY